MIEKFDHAPANVLKIAFRDTETGRTVIGFATKVLVNHYMIQNSSAYGESMRIWAEILEGLKETLG
jgi:hypothetical protein